jgi:hypothetical protein
MWSAFAIFAATAWERMPRWSQIMGGALVLGIGLTGGFIAWRLPRLVHDVHSHWGATAERSTAWRTVASIPLDAWLGFRGMFVVVALSLILFSILALWFIWRERPRLGLTALTAAMIPIGFSMVDGVAQISPYFSLSAMALYLNERLAPNDKVIYEGSIHVGSSLLFYLNRKFYLVNQDPATEPGNGLGEHEQMFLKQGTVTDAWTGSDRIYLLVEEGRVPYWQRILSKRGNSVERLMTCGTIVLLSNGH